MEIKQLLLKYKWMSMIVPLPKLDLCIQKAMSLLLSKTAENINIINQKSKQHLFWAVEIQLIAL